MSGFVERPWLDLDDFAQVASETENWTEMAKVYTDRGFPTSRDTMRRTGIEKHGISPGGTINQQEVELRSRVKQLEGQLVAVRREAVGAISEAESRPREAEPEELLKSRKRIESLSAELSHERKLNKTGVREANLIDEVRNLLLPVTEAYRVAPVAPPEPLGDPSGTPVSAGLVWCDQHWGKNVDPITVHGLNNYNPTIAAMRYESSVYKFRKLRRLWANEHQVDELVILLNGDPVNNDHQLHPDDASDIGRVSKQVLDCSVVTAQAISDLAHEFPFIRVICCGSDNHGRGGRKAASGKAGIENSWTALFHEQVASLCMHLEHVEFEHIPSYQALFNIKGRSFAAAHGHHLQGGGGQLGIPAYAMKRHADATLAKTVMMLKARDWTSVDTPEAFAAAVAGIVDHVIISHFHSRQILDFGGVDVRLAPSMVGTDTYVYNNLGKIAKAGTLAFIVHPEYGIIADHLLDLQKVMVEGPTRYNWGTLEDGTMAADIMKDWLRDSQTA